MRYILFIALSSFVFLVSCTNSSQTEDRSQKLPIFPKTNPKTGEIVDANHKISDFSFMNQDSQVVTNTTFKDKMYVWDIFFIHCPTICPKVKSNMRWMYDQLEGQEDVALVSLSMDTKYDTIPALKAYANKLEIETDRWHLMTGEKKEIFRIASDYNAAALEGDQYEGGFDHSGSLVLIDKEGHIRAMTRGTEREGAEKMLDYIKKLRKEYENKE